MSCSLWEVIFTYTGVASPPPVTDEAKPNGVPLTTEEIVLAESAVGAATPPKADKAVAATIWNNFMTKVLAWEMDE